MPKDHWSVYIECCKNRMFIVSFVQWSIKPYKKNQNLVLKPTINFTYCRFVFRDQRCQTDKTCVCPASQTNTLGVRVNCSSPNDWRVQTVWFLFQIVEKILFLAENRKTSQNDLIQKFDWDIKWFERFWSSGIWTKDSPERPKCLFGQPNLIFRPEKQTILRPPFITVWNSNISFKICSPGFTNVFHMKR